MSAGTERFAGDAEMTVELMHWRRCPGVCSRWRKQQPERLGCRQWRVWPTARWGDWWRLNGGSVDQERRRRVWAVPGIATRCHEELGKPARRPGIICTPGLAANEGWLSRTLYLASIEINGAFSLDSAFSHSAVR